MNPARQAAIHAGFAGRPRPRPHREPRLWLRARRPSFSAAQEIWLGNIKRRGRGRHGEHGSGALSRVARRPLGLSHGRRSVCSTAFCRDGPERCLLRRPLGLAYRRPRDENSQVTREAQDRWALRSQQLFREGAAGGQVQTRRSCRWKVSDRGETIPVRQRMSTTAPGHDASRPWRASSLPFARTAPSPQGMHLG